MLFLSIELGDFSDKIVRRHELAPVPSFDVLRHDDKRVFIARVSEGPSASPALQQPSRSFLKSLLGHPPPRRPLRPR